MERLSFHCFVHGFPQGPSPGPLVSVRDRAIPTVQFAPPLPALPLTFDYVAEQLTAIEGLHFEPDGSFVWGCGSGAERWQVDGQLTDGGLNLEFVELRGDCPSAALDELLAAFTGGKGQVLFQLVAEGVFLDRAAFWAVSQQQ